MKNTSLSLKSVSSGILHFLHRYHIILFVITVIGGLAVATLMINHTINEPLNTVDQSSVDTFDKDTMEKVKQLRKPNEAPAPLELPAGRINPFI